MEDTLVSVVLPTFNRASTLERAMTSVLTQSYERLELIVVDDASSDNTGTLVSGFADPRIRYVRHEQRRGGNAARNTGIKEAKGDLIAFQDSDDEWVAGKLESQVRLLASADPSVGVVFSRFVRVGSKGARIIPRRAEDVAGERVPTILRKRSIVSTQTMLVRKAALEHVGGFDESLPRFQDWDLALRLSFDYRFVGQEDVLSIVYEMKDSISANPDSACEALGCMLKKFAHRPGFLKGFAAELNYMRARFATGRYRARASEFACRAIRECPSNMKYWTYYFLVKALGAGASTVLAKSLSDLTYYRR